MTVTLALFEKYDSQCTQTSQNTECPVGYSVYFVIIFVWNIVYFTHLFLIQFELFQIS